jgi:hypothetical protein
MPSLASGGRRAWLSEGSTMKVGAKEVCAAAKHCPLGLKYVFH